jgi:hypothetical protein
VNLSRGDLAEVRISPLPGGIDLFERAPWVTYYTYEYDTRGNWTSMTERTERLDSGLVGYTGVTRRALKYWELLES